MYGKHRVASRACPLIVAQIDLESSDDDIQEIQQEISVLSTCASPFVTQYKTSFLRGYKLWIVMEYLGGGSCLDLVTSLPATCLPILTILAQTGFVQ
jgi:serine/threonine-protein kinase 24/25/MST4